jgi:hypothetical protein
MRTTLTLLFLALVAGLKAQVITKLHEGSSTFYYDVTQLHMIVAGAMSGDTIILPGGPIATGGFNLNKELTFIGAGILGTGTPVTGKTIVPYAFNMDIVIQQGSEGSSFHGIDFQRPVRFTGGVSDVAFTRCAFDLFPMAGFNMTAPSNVHIKHCIFRSGITNGGSTAPQGLVITNCIIDGGISLSGGVASAQVTYCLILDMNFSSGLNPGVTYSNNIFTRTFASYTLNHASYYACNLFCMTGGTTLTWSGATDLGGNLGWQLAGNNIFQNVPDINAYNETYDYHLSAGSPGLSTAQMSCAQGEVGIYGGPTPWKEGAIPFNPHWLGLNPALGGTNGGVINVNLSGAAQQD